MKNFFLVYGHYNEKSFNAAIRDEFIKTVKENGHEVDYVDLYKEKFDPVFSGEKPDATVLDHRKRIEKLDIFTYEQINDFLAIGIDFEADKFKGKLDDLKNYLSNKINELI